MAQADRWRHAAHRISVAVPRPTPRKRVADSRIFAERVLRDRGIGLIVVERHGVVDQLTPGRFFRCSAEQLRSSLGEQHKHDGAGSTDSFWSPYRPIKINGKRRSRAPHSASHDGLAGMIINAVEALQMMKKWEPKT